jgi:hypothetical protein
MEMFISLEPEGLDHSPNLGDKCFEKAGSLMFVVWLACKDQVEMLSVRPFCREVSVEDLHPADALLGGVEGLVSGWEHIGWLVSMFRVKEKKEGVLDQCSDRGVNMAFVE